MIATLTLTLKIYLAVWFWCGFEPIQDLLARMFTRLPSNYVTDVLFVASGCTKCLTLWITLIATGSIWWALGASMAAHIQSKIFE